IRQSLIMENKTSKYFKYAIGEIILVVIGILIALSINNWNTANQAHKLELGILNELKEGLKNDQDLLKNTFKKDENDHRVLLILDSLLKNPKHPYTKNMDTLFGKVYGIRNVRLNHAFYEDLKSSGLQIIRDKRLRAQIVDLFENNYQLLETFLENERSVNQVVRPYYLDNFVALDFKDSATPIDYQKIWNDPKYRNIVHYRIISLKFNQLEDYQNTIISIEHLIEKINDYIKE
uniref:DUF6090 family protein n=1 Tax=Winogradskyella sp. A3E31 TaxID=3349637 RepID=UPI00398B94DF